jgi:hypothetical protein
MTDYLIHVRPGPKCRIPHVIALRNLLKALLRCWGLVCISVAEVPVAAPEADDAPAAAETPIVALTAGASGERTNR